MKKLFITLLLVTSTCASAVTAQENETKGATDKDRSTSVSSNLPDWQSNYRQEIARDYVRRKAQERTAARQARIEGMKWLGHSPSRPAVSTTPFMSSAPSWVSAAPLGYWGPNFWPTAGHVQSFGWQP